MEYFMIFTLGFLQKDVENPWFPIQSIERVVMATCFDWAMASIASCTRLPEATQHGLYLALGFTLW